jgi:hypothetical protein
MNALPLILGAAALFFVASSKKPQSTSSKKDSETKPDVDLNEVKKIALPSKGFGLKSKICTDDQYLNSNDECTSFWNAQTPAIVLTAIQAEVAKLKNQSFDAKCVDSGEFDNIIPNQTPINIARTVIYKLWPEVKNKSLPPVDSDPKWLHTLWTRIINIYSKEICGFENKDPQW